MKLTIPKQSIFYAPTFEQGNLKTISTPLSHGNAIKMFCSTIKGERPLLPNWGLPEMVHDPIVDSDEIEAILLTNLKNYFSELNFTIDCKETELGHISCKINYSNDSVNDSIVIEF